ncbi:MAG: methylcrotonoyl-CoA carboxylase, partial [Rhodanobacteraceae bacterium]
MPVIPTRIDNKSESFRANAANLRKLTDDLKAELARTAEGGGEKARAKHTARAAAACRER